MDGKESANRMVTPLADVEKDKIWLVWPELRGSLKLAQIETFWQLESESDTLGGAE